MKKKLLFIVLGLSILINVVLFVKIHNETAYNTELFENGFIELIESLESYSDKETISNESSIKISATIVNALNIIRDKTIYKDDEDVSEILRYLNRFFVLNSNTYINNHIGDFREALILVSEDFSSETHRVTLKNKLWDLVKRPDITERID